MASHSPLCSRQRDPGQREHLELARERLLEAAARLLAVDRGQEADLAEVDREHRHAGAGVPAQGGQDRAVAAEREADVDVDPALDVDLEPRARARGGACASPRDRRTGSRRRPRAISISESIAGRVSDGRRWVSTVAVRTGFTARPRARPAPDPRAARRAALGQPHERLEIPLRTRAARSSRSPARWRRARPRAEPTDDQRGAGARGVAHHAALADLPAPHLELGLDQRQAVEPLRRAGQHGRQHLGQRDERHVDHDQIGRVRQLARAGATARCSARSRSPADRSATASRARRRRRRPRPRARRRPGAGSR